MEPITHFLTGACIGRAGLNRKTAYATLAAVLAAEAADLDVLWGFAGPVNELKHHRGFTHTFLGAPVVAGVVVGAIWLGHLWRERRRNRKTAASGEAAGVIASDSQVSGPLPVSRARQPVRWGWLYAAAFIAALSHVLLDWTNNYGVRPFFPFNPRWYAGSFVFIVDPVVWALLFLALLMPWILGLADREIGARRKPFRGRGWAIFALAGMAVLGGLRWWQHGQAISLSQGDAVTRAHIDRLAAEPYPINPFRWHVIAETPDFYQTAEVNTWDRSVDTNPQTDVIYKPIRTPAVEAAVRTFLGRVYLDWGTWAVVRDMGQEPVAGLDSPKLPPGRAWTTVRFSDLRFRYSFTASRSNPDASPLSGWVYIIDGRENGGEIMNGRAQK